ncbi:response regulator transcription factor [Fulvivirga lutimaris]|uniref:response regulator transcription factor n=1 Tax=Fulvivirga lutimaris TaxID=1819566 RepID=UPI001626E0F6|nr:LuxR C-terminal-related transcriptional regulator [Fulvivirga lutimaris]
MQSIMKIGLISGDQQYANDFRLILNVCNGYSFQGAVNVDQVDWMNMIFKNSDVVIIDLDSVNYKSLYRYLQSDDINIIGVGGNAGLLDDYLEFGIISYQGNKYAYKDILDMITFPDSNSVFKHLVNKSHQVAFAIDSDLTLRELEVLKELGRSLSYNQIANKLFISKETVKTHLENIYSKLEVKSRFNAVEKARNIGIM